MSRPVISELGPQRHGILVVMIGAVDKATAAATTATTATTGESGATW